MFKSLKEKFKNQMEKLKKQKAKKVLKEIDKVIEEKERLKAEKKELKELKKEKIEFKLKIPFFKKKKPKEVKEEIKEIPEEPEEEKEEPIEEKKEEPKKEEPKKGIIGQLSDIKETLDIITDKKKQGEKLKKKKFKLPFKVKSQLKKLAVKDKVQVLLLQRTRNIKPVIGEIRDGILLVKGMVYNGSVDSTWLWNGKYPTHLVPEWDLQPMTPEGIEEMKATSTLSPQELMSYCLKYGRSSEPAKIIIRMIEAKQNLMLKPGTNMRAIIITIVVVIIIMAVLFGGGAI